MRGSKPTPDYRAVARFRSALRAFDRAAEEAARAAGLTMQRYLLLLMVKGAPAGDERATINDVAERLRVAPHTITGAAELAAEIEQLEADIVSGAITVESPSAP